MIIGKFAGKTFEVSPSRIYTFGDFSLSGELDTATAEASGKKPATTINGPGLLKIGTELRLLASAGVDVQAEIDGWMELKDARSAYPFILCGKAVSLNGFLLKSCGASDYVFSRTASGPYLAAATLKLDFEEYLLPGAQSGKKKSGSAAGLVNDGTAKNPYKTPTSSQKAAAKRTNTGMAKVMLS